MEVEKPGSKQAWMFGGYQEGFRKEAVLPWRRTAGVVSSCFSSPGQVAPIVLHCASAWPSPEESWVIFPFISAKIILWSHSLYTMATERQG